MLSIAIQPTGVTLNPTTSSIMVSWTAPQFITPDSFNVSVGCLRLCDGIPTKSGVLVVPDGGATSHTITPLDPGNFCTVKVIAVFGRKSNESGEAFTITLTEGTVCTVLYYYVSIHCLSLSLSL